MAIQWQTYREQIRRSVLNDVELSQWSDETLSDCAGWALDTFCAHTALPKTYTLDADSNALLDTPYDLSTETVFNLPDDMYEGVEFEGQIAIVKSGVLYHLDPRENTPGMHPYSYDATPTYHTFEDSTVILSEPIGVDGTLVIRYYAYFPKPVDDTDTLAIPRWAEQAIAFLTGSYALAQIAIQSANIDRWKEKSDSGQPEQNALKAMQEYMFQQYERAIARYPTQDRVNYFRRFFTGEDQW